MLKINNKAITILSILLFYTCLSLLLLNVNAQLYFKLNPIFWICMFTTCYFFFKDDYSRRKYKYDFIQIVIISVIVYLILYYTFGLITGYSKLPYARNIIGIIKNIFYYVLPLALEEYIRFTLIVRSGKKKSILMIITGIFAVLSIMVQAYNFSISNLNDVFDLSFSIIIPEIAKSMLLSYLSYHSNFIAPIIYVVVPTLLMYIIPIIPDLNWFLDGSIKLLLAFTIYFTCNHFYVSKQIVRSKKTKMYFTLTPLLIIIIPLIILISGVFKYQLMAVLTNSMKPIYERGDAVLVRHLEDSEKEKLKKGDIIVFTYNKRMVLHRIVNISYDSNGNRIYKTKGDNLDQEDAWYVKDSDITAKYILTIYKIGYPSVWLNDLTEKE